MIYKTEIENFHLFESYKERNLYYKIFAGYFFNEIIPEYSLRKERFINALAKISTDKSRVYDPSNQITSLLENLGKEKWNVTFDYHTAQIFAEDKRDDRGEMSDVLITSNKAFLSIECKFLSNFTIEKDIYSVQARIAKFATQFNLLPIQVLLLKQEKWGYSKKLDGRIIETITGSFSPIIVMFWEDLLSIIDNKTVSEFLEKQLNRNLKSVV
jgi:hypothetical protein